MISVVPASPAHVGVIANRMRADDVEECRAMGFTPKQALRTSIRQSSEAWTVKVDGRPEAMFGLVVTSALGGQGRPWMLGTDAIYRHPRAMIRYGRRVLERWLDSTQCLTNLVSVGNHRALRMLRRWGCSIRGEVIVFAGTEFVTFTLSR
jgi:hypothetical protein